MLASEHDVNVDDKRGEWALLGEEYLLDPDGTSFAPDDNVTAAVGRKLGKRITARKERDFDKADNIREDLRRDYMVEIDDRTKEWKVVSPEGGRWADDEDASATDNVVIRQEWEDDSATGDVASEQGPDDDGGDVRVVADRGVDAAEEMTGDENPLDAAELSKMTVPKLKEMLWEAGLPVSGRKRELIERLTSA